jgi:uncharacterized membrane protein
MRKVLSISLVTIAMLFGIGRPVHAQSGPAVVRAVLFYSPRCGHCHYVITEALPPLIEKYGSQLQLVGIDVTQPDGSSLFSSVLQKFNLEAAGVPFLVVGNDYLVGSVDIPEKFPALIEHHLASGGVGWPDIPGLANALAAMASQASPNITPSPLPTPVVHALLIYRSECAHCKQLMDEFIPPLLAQYGNQLQIFGVDASLPTGDDLYGAVIQRFDMHSLGVPTLIIGDRVLLGADIQQNSADIIDGYLSKGGVDWPDVPGLAQMLAEAQATTTPAASSQQSTRMIFSGIETVTPTPGILLAGSYPIGSVSGFASDPVGNSLAVVVLVGMVLCLAWVIHSFRRLPRKSPQPLHTWAIPVLCLLGLGVAGYLAYVETSQVEAVCGPVGDCNTVQQSEYARLFGILPIGVLGIIGYIMILTSWVVQKYSSGGLANYAALALWIMAAFGFLFSIYLTLLEPFVIGATCAWCLTSAVIMTLLMLISLDPAKAAMARWKRRTGKMFLNM